MQPFSLVLTPFARVSAITLVFPALLHKAHSFDQGISLSLSLSLFGSTVTEPCACVCVCGLLQTQGRVYNLQQLPFLLSQLRKLTKHVCLISRSQVYLARKKRGKRNGKEVGWLGLKSHVVLSMTSTSADPPLVGPARTPPPPRHYVFLQNMQM